MIYLEHLFLENGTALNKKPFCMNNLKWCTFLIICFFILAPPPVTDPPLDLAKKCDYSECQLPYCFCSKDGTIIPGGLEAEDVSRTI